MGIDGQIVQLDVRPYLRKKLEPFQLIMNTVNGLKHEQLLLLHATFKPTPLLGLLKMKGYENRLEQVGPDHWIVAFLHKSQGKARLEAIPFQEFASIAESETEASVGADECNGSVAEHIEAEHITAQRSPAGRAIELDNRGLEPPQPMVRTLKALEQCEPGDQVVIHNDRVPMFLIQELQQLGYSYQIEEQPDGSAKAMITKG